MARKKATPEPPKHPDPMRGEGSAPPSQPQRDRLEDLRLYRYALSQGWSVPADLKASATKRLGEMLANPKAGDRAWTAAARTLVSMTTATLSSIDTAIRAKQSDELAQEVKTLRDEVDQIKGGPTP